MTVFEPLALQLNAFVKENTIGASITARKDENKETRNGQFFEKHPLH